MRYDPAVQNFTPGRLGGCRYSDIVSIPPSLPSFQLKHSRPKCNQHRKGTNSNCPYICSSFKSFQSRGVLRDLCIPESFHHSHPPSQYTYIQEITVFFKSPRYSTRLRVKEEDFSCPADAESVIPFLRSAVQCGTLTRNYTQRKSRKGRKGC